MLPGWLVNDYLKNVRIERHTISVFSCRDWGKLINVHHKPVSAEIQTWRMYTWSALLYAYQSDRSVQHDGFWRVRSFEKWKRTILVYNSKRLLATANPMTGEVHAQLPSTFSRNWNSSTSLSAIKRLQFCVALLIFGHATPWLRQDSGSAPAIPPGIPGAQSGTGTASSPCNPVLPHQQNFINFLILILVLYCL